MTAESTELSAAAWIELPPRPLRDFDRQRGQPEQDRHRKSNKHDYDAAPVAGKSARA
jgi:hypothetical protein